MSTFDELPIPPHEHEHARNLYIKGCSLPMMTDADFQTMTKQDAIEQLASMIEHNSQGRLRFERKQGKVIESSFCKRLERYYYLHPDFLRADPFTMLPADLRNVITAVLAADILYPSDSDEIPISGNPDNNANSPRSDIPARKDLPARKQIREIGDAAQRLTDISLINKAFHRTNPLQHIPEDLPSYYVLLTLANASLYELPYAGYVIVAEDKELKGYQVAVAQVRRFYRHPVAPVSNTVDYSLDHEFVFAEVTPSTDFLRAVRTQKDIKGNPLYPASYRVFSAETSNDTVPSWTIDDFFRDRDVPHPGQQTSSIDLDQPSPSPFQGSVVDLNSYGNRTSNINDPPVPTGFDNEQWKSCYLFYNGKPWPPSDSFYSELEMRYVYDRGMEIQQQQQQQQQQEEKDGGTRSSEELQEIKAMSGRSLSEDSPKNVMIRRRLNRDRPCDWRNARVTSVINAFEIGLEIMHYYQPGDDIMDKYWDHIGVVPHLLLGVGRVHFESNTIREQPIDLLMSTNKDERQEAVRNSIAIEDRSMRVIQELNPCFYPIGGDRNSPFETKLYDGTNEKNLVFNSPGTVLLRMSMCAGMENEGGLNWNESMVSFYERQGHRFPNQPKSYNYHVPVAWNAIVPRTAYQLQLSGKWHPGGVEKSKNEAARIGRRLKDLLNRSLMVIDYPSTYSLKRQ
jgi:hypothetical protein